jgi:hypothetical protein
MVTVTVVEVVAGAVRRQDGSERSRSAAIVAVTMRGEGWQTRPREGAARGRRRDEGESWGSVCANDAGVDGVKASVSQAARTQNCTAHEQHRGARRRQSRRGQRGRGFGVGGVQAGVRGGERGAVVVVEEDEDDQEPSW